jgi:hypothetical protein
MEEALLKKKGFADADQSLPKFFFFFFNRRMQLWGIPKK